MKYQVAAIQMSSTNNVNGNLRTIEQFVEEAAHAGARLICLPENCAFMGKKQADVIDVAEPLQLEDFAWATAPIQSKLARLSKEYGVFIIAGGVPIKSIFKDKVYQTQIVFSPKGTITDYYHKVHLFDVNIPRSEKQDAEQYRESDTYLSDKLLVTTPIDKLSVGLTICYDLRFPEQYRKLAQLGANVFTAPAAFTKRTGQVHWLPLLKARAIENMAYVIAPAQYGRHASGRETFGYSAIIDPWGRVAALKEVGQGVIMAEINLEQQVRLRKEFPVLEHIKLL